MTWTQQAQKQRDKIINKIPSFPSLPTAAVKARELLAKPEVDFYELAHNIRYDQALTVNLLKIANTVKFGGRRKVHTVIQALIRIGTSNLSQIIAALSTSSFMKKKIKGYDLGPMELWKHAMAVGIAAEKLARKLNVKKPELAFTAGLLHDIGKIVLGTFVKTDIKAIKRQIAENHIPFHLAERRVLGIDHAEIGARLLRHWGLPARLVYVVRWHHQPNESSKDYKIVDLVHIADAMTLQAGIGIGNADGLNYMLYKDSMKRLNLDRTKAQRVIVNTQLELEDLSTIFE